MREREEERNKEKDSMNLEISGSKAGKWLKMVALTKN